MPAIAAPALTFLLGFVLAMLASHRFADLGGRRQREILQKGRPAQAIVTDIWQPPVAGSFARIYFVFEPEGAAGPVRCCHIDRRIGQNASLPAPGSEVSIRYLPETPRQAVIAKLVSRFF